MTPRHLSLYFRYRNIALLSRSSGRHAAALQSPPAHLQVSEAMRDPTQIRSFSELPSQSNCNSNSHDLTARFSPSASAPFRRRRVVSSFLVHGTPGTSDFRVSVFKRSTAVRTYKGKWAACSGSVDTSDISPLRAALRELEEETGLREDQLVRVGNGGRPLADREEGLDDEDVRFELRDDAIRILWEVWPFCWRVLDRDGSQLGLREAQNRIVLNWENDEMRWVSLEEMQELETVENLVKGVEVVLGSLEATNRQE